MSTGKMCSYAVFIVIFLVSVFSSLFAEDYDTKNFSKKRMSSLIINDGAYIDVNNLAMFVSNGGSFAFDLDNDGAGFYFPKGSSKICLFSAGLSIGAMVDGELRMAVAKHVGDPIEFRPGTIENGSSADPDDPRFRVYKITTGDGPGTTDWDEWPVADGAPADNSGNPLLLGDQTLWTVFNDADPSYHVDWIGNPEPLGVEVQLTVFAYRWPNTLANTIFLKYKIINKGSNRLENTYLFFWGDPDISPYNDFTGYNSNMELGYCYNSSNVSDKYKVAAPSVGFLNIQGPEADNGSRMDLAAFITYPGEVVWDEPKQQTHLYNIMHGLNPDGTPILNPITGQPTTFMNNGNPISETGWFDTHPGDKRFALISGPFTMKPNDTQDVIYAVIVGQGANRLNSVERLQTMVPPIIAIYDAAFPKLNPPEFDAAVVTIDEPANGIKLEQPLLPSGTVANLGSETVSFGVEYNIGYEGMPEFQSTKITSMLTPGQTEQIMFDEWTPSIFGIFDVTLTTLLAGDADVSNDNLSARIEIRPSLELELVARTDNQAALKWNEIPPSMINGYNIYRSNISGGPYTRLNETLITANYYTDETISTETVYYNITCVFADESESDYIIELPVYPYMTVNDDGILLVNGVDWGYDQIISFFNTNMAGLLPYDFWDLFTDNPINLSPLGEGPAPPPELLFNYKTIIWLGNNWGGDLELWLESLPALKQYLLFGGNLLLAARTANDFFDNVLNTSYAHIDSWSGNTGIGDDNPLISIVPGLVDMRAGNGSDYSSFANMFHVSSESLPDNIVAFTPIFEFWDGSEYWNGGFRSELAGGGQFVFISGRPYRFDQSASQENYNFILSAWFGHLLPFIEIVDYYLSDNGKNQSYGNGDGQANPGEFIEIFPHIFNSSTTTQYDIYGIPDRYYDPYISPNSVYLFDDYLEFGNAEPGEVINYDDLDCYIASNTPEGHVMKIPIQFYNGNDMNIGLDTLSFTVTGTDETPPQIRDGQTSPSYTSVGNKTTISVYIKEAGVISEVNAHINTLDEANVATISLNDDGINGDLKANDFVFSGQWTVTKQADFYIDFDATDEFSNFEYAENLAGLTSNPPPTPTADILLVDDDDYNKLNYGNPKPYNEYYQEALDDLGYNYDIWSVYFYGAPSADFLNNYINGAVIWETGDCFENTLTAEDRNALTTYLQAGGNFFISGQDMGYELNHSSNEALNWYNDYLYANFVQDFVYLYQVEGVNNDPISDSFNLTIEGGDGANNQLYASELDPIPPAVSIFYYQISEGEGNSPSYIVHKFDDFKFTSDRNIAKIEPDYLKNTSALVPVQDIISSGTAALRVNTGVFKVVYFAFGFEGIDNSDDRAQLMDRILKWFQEEPANAVSLPHITAGYEDVVNIPVTVTTDSSIGLVHFVIEYDSTIIEFENAQTGADISGFALMTRTNLPFLTSNTNTNKSILLSINGGGAYYFSGINKEVAVLNFTVIDNEIGHKSPLVFDNDMTHTFLTTSNLHDLSNGDIAFNNGSIEVIEKLFNISGNITYNCTNHPVSGVKVQAVHPEEMIEVTTNETGDYLIGGMNEAEISLNASKDENSNSRNIIKGSDVLLLMQYLAFIRDDLTQCQESAADITQDGRISGSDALGILRYLAFYTTGIGQTGKWQFMPADTSFTLDDDAFVDFNGCILGDVNGSWSNTALSKSQEMINATVTMSHPGKCGTNEFILPVNVDFESQIINTLILSIEYEYEQLEYKATTLTPLTSGFTIVDNGSEQGKVHIAMAALNGFSKPGDVINLVFEKRQNSYKTSTQLNFKQFFINDLTPLSLCNATIDFEKMKLGIPTTYKLSNAYPNPFNPETVIEYQLPKDTNVSLRIYDILGQKVKTLVDQKMNAGYHKVLWNGTNNMDKSVASGLYLYQLETDDFSSMKRMILLR